MSRPQAPDHFIHCRQCVTNLPRGKSPAEHARLQVSMSHDGQITIWCVRHDLEVGSFKLAEVPDMGCETCAAHRKMDS